MVINTNSVGSVTSNNLTTPATGVTKPSRSTTVPSDDVTLSSRHGEGVTEHDISEIWDSAEADEASEFARRYILSDSDSTLRVQANLKAENVWELLAE